MAPSSSVPVGLTVSVDTISAEPVADPAELGIIPERLDALLTRVRREVEAGELPSCQVALAKDGRLAAFATFGDASDDNHYVIYSATKPIISLAVLLLAQEGRLDIEAPVAEVIGEFAANDKAGITIEQVMLHTSGFPRAPLGAPAWFDRAARLERFSNWKCNWDPGTRYEYHATSAHWVLAELIERVAGVTWREFVADRLAGPLGLARLQVGEPPEQRGLGLLQELRGEEATEDELEAALGIRRMPVTEVTDDALMEFNEPDVRALGVPGGGGVTTAATLALFYQHVLHDPTGLWDPQMLADAKANVRNRLPDFMKTPALRTLAFITAGDDGRSHQRGMGRTVSPAAFGHNGASGQLAWADPATGLSFAYFTNGIERHYLKMHRRGTALSSLAGLCTTP